MLLQSADLGRYALQIARAFLIKINPDRCSVDASQNLW